MSFWMYFAVVLAVSVLIASRMDIVTAEELSKDPWEKKSM